MTQRTLGGTQLKAIRVSGFRAKMGTRTGRNIIKKRRQKNRKKLTLTKRN